MTNLQIQSTFKRSNNLEELIEEQFHKIKKICHDFNSANIFLKKERNALLSDIVTINIAIKGQKIITVTVQDTLFEKAIKNAFKVVRRQIKNKVRSSTY